MKSTAKILFIFIFCLTAFIAEGQTGGEAIIHKVDSNSYGTPVINTKTIFRFFNAATKKQFVPSGGIVINGVTISADTSGKVAVFLAKGKYRVSSLCMFYKEIPKFKLKIVPAFRYDVDIYLDRDMTPVSFNDRRPVTGDQLR